MYLAYVSKHTSECKKQIIILIIPKKKDDITLK